MPTRSSWRSQHHTVKIIKHYSVSCKMGVWCQCVTLVTPILLKKYTVPHLKLSSFSSRWSTNWLAVRLTTVKLCRSKLNSIITQKSDWVILIQHAFTKLTFQTGFSVSWLSSLVTMIQLCLHEVSWRGLIALFVSVCCLVVLV